jgi:hypothetical protein
LIIRHDVWAKEENLTRYVGFTTSAMALNVADKSLSSADQNLSKYSHGIFKKEYWPLQVGNLFQLGYYA